MDPLRLSSFSSNVDALNEAWSSGAPLRLDRDLVLEKDIRVTIGRGHRLELFGGRIISAPGSLILNAEKIATLGLAETVAQGDHGITVDDASLVEPGDLVHIDSRISLGPDQWRMGDLGVVERMTGDRLELGWPLNWRYHPNRRLDYIADGEQRVYHYRLYWVPGSEARVLIDGQPVDDIEITHRDHGHGAGFDIRFDKPPQKGSRISLTTETALPVEVYRGGALYLHDLEVSVDRQGKQPNHVVIHGTPPVGARYERLRLRELNWDQEGTGVPNWGGAIFLRVNTVGACLADIDIEGGGYGVMLRGRDTHIRRVTARDAWHPISSFHYNSHTHVNDLRCVNCVTTIDGHGGSFLFARDIHGERVNGAGIRVNGASLIDADFSPAPDREFGIRIGVHHQAPVNERNLADPRDNPVNMLDHSVSGIANDVLIQDIRAERRENEDGIYIIVVPAHRVTLRNITGAGPIDFEYGPIAEGFVHHLIMEDVACGVLRLSAVRRVTARQVTAGLLDISSGAGAAAGFLFESCRFDASVSEHDWIIDDRHNNGTTPRRFVDCHFTGKARLLAEGPMDRYEFINCTGPGL